MAVSDDEGFRVRPRPPKARPGGRSQVFVSQVLKAASRSGARAVRARGTRPTFTFGRGRVAAGVAGRGLGPYARRVIVKSRFVVLKRAGHSAVTTHLRYIEREGVTREGRKGQAYGADSDVVDLKAFEARAREDRHQFRFIISPEDATELEDLTSFTRQLMRRMETDLETPLDWVAVDHWDTDNPHTHIVINGHVGHPVHHKGKGRDLVIAPDYMAHGMRLRACEIATQWLGPRTDAEIRRSLQRDVEQERLTSLDRQLIRIATADIVNLTEGQGSVLEQQRQTLLRARLQRLEAQSLAERIDAHRWHLASDLEKILVDMGERGDLLRTMHRAMRGERRELVIDTPLETSCVGCIVAKGLDDELNDRAYLVVDCVDGRARYLKLPAGTDLANFPIGGIVECSPPVRQRTVDLGILSAAREGVYLVAAHHADGAKSDARDPQTTTAEARVRRLEALRRSGIVERVSEGVWKIPVDLMAQATAHDARRADGHAVELRTPFSIERQVTAVGATWLDRNLVVSEDRASLAASGFGGQVREAMARRVDFLAAEGLAEHSGLRTTFPRNLLATLRNRELARTGREVQERTGKTWHAVPEGQTARGVYREAIQLVSGRYALLDDGLGFSLVPWRPVIEHRLGQELSAVVRGRSVNWIVGRQRGLAV